MIAFLDGRLISKLTLADNVSEVVVDVGGIGYQVFVADQTFAKLPASTDRVQLWIHTYVREETFALYGFLDPIERKFFQILLTARGVGPSLGLSLLSLHSPLTIWEAVTVEDVDLLSLVPGIGPKTAARLCLELKNRLPDRHVLESWSVGLSALGYEADEGKTNKDATDEGAPSTDKAVLVPKPAGDKNEKSGSVILGVDGPGNGSALVDLKGALEELGYTPKEIRFALSAIYSSQLNASMLNGGKQGSDSMDSRQSKASLQELLRFALSELRQKNGNIERNRSW
ncbi:MAG: Holliday junction branch migration protein RuvA [Actinobacteria bacterium]|nr:Holliday junction branch migration protein RuvA [Actinomycetota bacterium]MCL6105533.1 Holliday junction branch migration protein RuvA [Actinomycetota bacterium]